NAAPRRGFCSRYAFSPHEDLAILPPEFAEVCMRLSINTGIVAGTLGMTAALLGAPGAQAADFYAGKTIHFIIGSDAAGGSDVYARAIARHLPRFIPGNPTIVPQNMPGAGSAK